MDRLRELYEISLKHNLQLEAELKLKDMQIQYQRDIIGEMMAQNAVKQAKENGTWG
jgi:hypothetical protein